MQKAGAAHSKDTLAKLQQMHHEIAAMGGACKCDKCMKMYGAQQETNKAAEDADLHKTLASDDGMKGELSKAMEGLNDLKKVVGDLKSENIALKKTVGEIRGTLYYPYIVYCDSISQVLEGDTFEADFNGKVINARVSFVITNELGTKIKVRDYITDGN